MSNKSPKNYNSPISFISYGSKQNDQLEKKNKEEKQCKEGKQSFKNSFNNTMQEQSLLKNNIGNWEVYEKGIGGKLLLKMGYEPGKGLGKQLQGISTPIETPIRRGRGAIGSENVKISKPVFTDQDEKVITKGTTKTLQYHKKYSKREKRKKYSDTNKSADVLIKNSKFKPCETLYRKQKISRDKIIDMTGPEPLILNGYQQSSSDYDTQSEKNIDTNSALPELIDDLNISISLEKCNVLKHKKERQYLGRGIALDSQYIKVVDNTEEFKQNAEYVLNIVKELTDPKKDISLEKSAEMIKNLQDNYYDHYKKLDVGNLASNLVGSKMKLYLKNWNLINEPSYPLQLFKKWRIILQCESTTFPGSVNSTNSYDKLMWNIFMPLVRKAAEEWNCHQLDLVEFLKIWRTLIPKLILEQIVDTLILPKLILEVNQWNPIIDTDPIHIYIHSWSPLINDQLNEEVYPIVRKKLSAYLNNLHHLDKSAYFMLKPWCDIFSKADLNKFLILNILPKLENLFKELDINSDEQNLENWNCVMQWKELLPHHIMATLLDNFFFPKFLQNLVKLLNNIIINKSNDEQVKNFYLEWTRLLDANLISETIIKINLSCAENMINRTLNVQLSSSPSVDEQISANTLKTQTSNLDDPITVLLEYEDLVKIKCEERGISFRPILNRLKEGKILYKIGKVKVYIDNKVLFTCQDDVNWTPINLNDLLKTAET